jgi:hypothetical protein
MDTHERYLKEVFVDSEIAKIRADREKLLKEIEADLAEMDRRTRIAWWVAGTCAVLWVVIELLK